MNEDGIYRASSQFRFWSFMPTKLASLRSESNALASDHIKALVKRRDLAISSGDGTPVVSDADTNGASKKDNGDVECLEPKEEEELLKFYCNNLLDLGATEFKYPIHVVGTAIQYLKRFYVTHSLMEYPPIKIMPTALFLASKTENFMVNLDEFIHNAHQIRGMESLTRDTVLAPEFIFTQALRFHFDVKHTFRALKGLWLECGILINVCKGHRSPEGWSRMGDDEIRELCLQDGVSVTEFESRLAKGRTKADSVLRESALVSDSYFYYSPSQITFAAWYINQPDFLRTFLDIKLTGAVGVKEKHKIMDTIEACATLLKTFKVPDSKVLKPMNRKMIKCNKLNERDLMEDSKARKRGNDGVDEQKAKKRKLERERAEREDPFGPPLPAAK